MTAAADTATEPAAGEPCLVCPCCAQWLDASRALLDDLETTRTERDEAVDDVLALIDETLEARS